MARAESPARSHRPPATDGTGNGAASKKSPSTPFDASIARLSEVPRPYQVLDEDGLLVGEMPDLSDGQILDLCRWMVFGREMDRRGLQLQRQGRLGIWGPMLGQEAAQAGLGLAMREGDWIFPSYREATTLCMRGLDLKDILAYLRGLYWQADPYETGCFPVQILIGDQALHAVGAGMAFALQGQPRVAVASIGDGATSQGDFHEALNFAGVFQANAVVFVQNNGWAISMPRSRQTAAETLAQKAVAYGIPGVMVDGNDPLAVYAVCHWAIERARAGEGPALVEAVTYRLGAHTTADDPKRYQPPEEIETWTARDPLPRMRRFLESRGLWEDATQEQERQAAIQRIDEAIGRMEAEPVPPFDRVFETTLAAPTQALLEQQAGARQA